MRRFSGTLVRYRGPGTQLPGGIAYYPNTRFTASKYSMPCTVSGSR